MALIEPKTLRKLGWTCFGLMWIPFTTLMIGVYQLGPGQHTMSISSLPPLMLYSLIAVGVFFVLTFLFLIGSALQVMLPFFTGGRLKSRIHKHGRPGKAKILALYETGMTINQQPVAGFELEVHPEAGPVFRAKTEQLIRRLDIPLIQPGAEVNVRYDPDTRQVVIV